MGLAELLRLFVRSKMIMKYGTGTERTKQDEMIKVKHKKEQKIRLWAN